MCMLISPLFLVLAHTVSAVRLMRIEFGGAFADLLNEKGKGSGDNEMGYVERTLGFRSRAFNDRDLRLVSPLISFLYVVFTHFLKDSLYTLHLSIIGIGFNILKS